VGQAIQVTKPGPQDRSQVYGGGISEQKVVCRPKIAANSGKALREESCPADVAVAPIEEAAPMKRKIVVRGEKYIMTMFKFLFGSTKTSFTNEW